MSKQSRRAMLKALGLGAVGASLSWAGTLPPIHEGRPLDEIDGSIVGEDVSLGHRWRDGAFVPRDQTPKEFAADVVIVGAGIAGLTTAWCLARAGMKRVLLLERASQHGGLAVAGQHQGRAFPWGAHYVDPPDRGAKALLKIYEDLKIVIGRHPKDGRPICDPRYIVKPPHYNVYADGAWSRGIVPWHIVPPEEYEMIQAFARELERMAALRDAQGRRYFGYPLEALSTDASYRALDRITMLEYMRRNGWDSPILLWSINDRCIDEFSVPIDRISAWAGIQYYASVEPLKRLATPAGFPRDPIVEKISPSDRKMSWPNGNAFLADGLRRHLPKDAIRTHAMVLRLRNVPDGVVVDYLDTRTMQQHAVKARMAVFAAPKFMASRCIPELSARRRKEFGLLEYVPWIVASLHCRKRPRFPRKVPIAWENLRFRSWSQGFINPQHLLATPPAANKPHTFVFYASLASQPAIERRELLREGWEFWTRQILDEVERMNPSLVRLLTRIDIMRWGHAMHIPTPGYLFGSTREAMKRPCGRIYFSHCDVAGPAVFEQVTYRGVEVAEQLMKALSHPFTSIR